MPTRDGIVAAEFDVSALHATAARVENLLNSRRTDGADASARPSAPATRTPTHGSARASFLRRNLANMTQHTKLDTIYEEVMNLRDAQLNEGVSGEHREALAAAQREILDLRAQNNTLRAEIITERRAFETSARSPARQAIYVVAVKGEEDPFNVGSTASCLRLMRELEQMPLDDETTLEPRMIAGYLHEIVRLRRGTDLLHSYQSHHGSLSEAIEHANMDNERDMLEIWRMESPAAMANNFLSYRDPKLVAHRRPRNGFEHWHILDAVEASRFEKIHNIGAHQEVRDEEEI